MSYLQAVERRLDTLAGDPQRDLERQRRVADVAQTYRQALAALPPGQPTGEILGEVRWMIEELRVSLFAQELRTRYPISEQRIYPALDDLVTWRRAGDSDRGNPTNHPA